MKPVKLHLVREDEGPSDADLLQRVAAGELSALGTLYDRYAALLLRYAERVERNGGEDVVQTVFLRVTKIAARYDCAAPSARPWLFAITTRVLQERRRALRRATAALMRLAERPGRRAEPPVVFVGDLERALARLSVAKRSVLLLAEVEEFSCEEIASMLGVPVGTVWTRLHHARLELRRFYEEKKS